MQKSFLILLALVACLLLPRQANAQFRLGLQAGHYTPSSSLQEIGLPGGYGFGIDLMLPTIRLSRHLQLELGYRSLSGKHRIDKEIPFYANSYYSLDYTQTRSKLGVLRLIGPADWKLQPFVEGAWGKSTIGTYGSRHQFHSRTAGYVDRCPSTVREINSTSENIYGIGTGFIFPVSEKINLEMSVFHMRGQATEFIEINNFERARSFNTAESSLTRTSFTTFRMGISIDLVKTMDAFFTNADNFALKVQQQMESRPSSHYQSTSDDDDDDDDDDWFESSWDDDDDDFGPPASGSSGRSKPRGGGGGGSGCGGG